MPSRRFWNGLTELQWLLALDAWLFALVLHDRALDAIYRRAAGAHVGNLLDFLPADGANRNRLLRWHELPVTGSIKISIITKRGDVFWQITRENDTRGA